MYLCLKLILSRRVRERRGRVCVCMYVSMMNLMSRIKRCLLQVRIINITHSLRHYHTCFFLAILSFFLTLFLVLFYIYLSIYLSHVSSLLSCVYFYFIPFSYIYFFDFLSIVSSTFITLALIVLVKTLCGAK